MNEYNTLHGECGHPSMCDNRAVGYIEYKDGSVHITERACDEHYSQTIEEISGEECLDLIRHKRV